MQDTRRCRQRAAAIFFSFFFLSRSSSEGHQADAQERRHFGLVVHIQIDVAGQGAEGDGRGQGPQGG